MLSILPRGDEMQDVRSIIERERGQSIVEFALVLPVVLLLIFGLLEFGRVINAEISAGHCANELARYAVIGRTVQQVRDYAYDTPVCPTFNLEDEGTLNIAIDVQYPSGEGVGKAVVVEITYPIEIVVPLISGLFDEGTYTAHGPSTLQME